MVKVHPFCKKQSPSLAECPGLFTSQEAQTDLMLAIQRNKKPCCKQSFALVFGEVCGGESCISNIKVGKEGTTPSQEWVRDFNSRNKCSYFRVSSTGYKAETEVSTVSCFIQASENPSWPLGFWQRSSHPWLSLSPSRLSLASPGTCRISQITSPFIYSS